MIRKISIILDNRTRQYLMKIHGESPVKPSHGYVAALKLFTDLSAHVMSDMSVGILVATTSPLMGDITFIERHGPFNEVMDRATRMEGRIRRTSLLSHNFELYIDGFVKGHKKPLGTWLFTFNDKNGTCLAVNYHVNQDQYEEVA
ncbi:MAG TPA: hypothetical protein VGC58_01840 [Candidatus Paceibacterota bacterium]